MTKGFQASGFRVIGCDMKAQPNYCGDAFRQDDAISVLRKLLNGGRVQFGDTDIELGDLAGIHASPPCQAHAPVTNWRGSQADHPELIEPVRELLERSGLPFVIENVPEAPIRPDLHLCGTQFGLRVRRHRSFECNWLDPVMTWGLLPPCAHHPDDLAFDHGGKQPESIYREAMGCGWMTVIESRQAIPPAYAKFIGDLLRGLLGER